MLALWLTVALLWALVCFLHGFNGISNIEHHTGASASEVSGLNSTFHTVDAMANATSYALVKGGSAASAVVQAMGKFSHVAVQILNNCSSAPYAVANLNKTLPYVTSYALWCASILSCSSAAWVCGLTCLAPDAATSPNGCSSA